MSPSESKRPVPVRPSSADPALREGTGATDVAAFLRTLASVPAPATGRRGRLIFALDATASRQPTWDRACQLQAEMFTAAGSLGGLDVQLVFFRGFGECKHSGWTTDAASLARKMTGVTCLAGQTQIGRVLVHAAKEARANRVNALVFVGDACEEDPDRLGHLAGELGLLGVPAFLFQEGGDPLVASVFRQIAKLSGGAYCAFDGSSAQQLRDLLAAVATYAAGGRLALEHFGRTRGSEAVRQLTHQVAGSRRP